MVKEKRLQFVVSEEDLQRFESLVAELGLRTRADLLDNAFALFEWAVEEVKQGKVIASLDFGQGTYSEVLLPVLRKVKARRARTQPVKPRIPVLEEAIED